MLAIGSVLPLHPPDAWGLQELRGGKCPSIDRNAFPVVDMQTGLDKIRILQLQI
jgi:hypothetical protein